MSPQKPTVPRKQMLLFHQIFQDAGRTNHEAFHSGCQIEYATTAKVQNIEVFHLDESAAQGLGDPVLPQNRQSQSDPIVPAFQCLNIRKILPSKLWAVKNNLTGCVTLLSFSLPPLNSCVYLLLLHVFYVFISCLPSYILSKPHGWLNSEAKLLYVISTNHKVNF